MNTCTCRSITPLKGGNVYSQWYSTFLQKYPSHIAHMPVCGTQMDHDDSNEHTLGTNDFC